MKNDNEFGFREIVDFCLHEEVEIEDIIEMVIWVTPPVALIGFLLGFFFL